MLDYWGGAEQGQTHRLVYFVDDYEEREKECVHIEDRLVYTPDVFDSTNINTVYDSATQSNAQNSHTTARLASSVHTDTHQYQDSAKTKNGR